MNLLELLEPGCAEPAAVRAGWRRYVERTWGRPEMKARARFTAVAEELAPGLPESVRELFLVGIGARPGAVELALPALAPVRRDAPSIRRRTWRGSAGASISCTAPTTT